MYVLTIIPDIEKTLAELRREYEQETDPKKLRQLHSLITRFEWLRDDLKHELIHH